MSKKAKRQERLRLQSERQALFNALARYFEVRSNYRRPENPRPGEAHGFRIIATY